jgi:hypothetical protein
MAVWAVSLVVGLLGGTAVFVWPLDLLVDAIIWCVGLWGLVIRFYLLE